MKLRAHAKAAPSPISTHDGWAWPRYLRLVSQPAPSPNRISAANGFTDLFAPDGVMVFDGICNFCSGTVRLATLIDLRRVIRFSAIQSPYGQMLCERHGVDAKDPATFLFYERGRALEATDAMAALLARMQPPWRWLRFVTLIPRPFRNGFYRLIATNRYRLFGKRKTCRVPSRELRAQFIDNPPSAA